MAGVSRPFTIYHRLLGLRVPQRLCAPILPHCLAADMPQRRAVVTAAFSPEVKICLRLGFAIGLCYEAIVTPTL